MNLLSTKLFNLPNITLSYLPTSLHLCPSSTHSFSNHINYPNSLKLSFFPIFFTLTPLQADKLLLSPQVSPLLHLHIPLFYQAKHKVHISLSPSPLSGAPSKTTLEQLPSPTSDISSSSFSSYWFGST